MPSKILLPTGVGDHGDDFNLTGAATKHEAVDPGDPIAHDDQTSILTHYLKGARQSMKFEALSTEVPSAETVAELWFFVRFAHERPNQFLELRAANATDFDPANFVFMEGLPAFTDHGFPLAPADGGNWTVPKVDAAQSRLRVDTTSEGNFRLTSWWLVAVYAEAVTTVAAPDEVAARQLLKRRFAEEKYQVALRARAQQVAMGGQVQLVDSFGPESTGKGFGPKEWERRMLRPHRKTIDPNTQNVQLECRDPRRYLSTLFLQNIPTVGGSTRGTIKHINGNEETFARNSKAWIEFDDGKIHEIAVGDKKLGRHGQLIERGSTNWARNSSFVDGSTGYTLINSGNVALVETYLFGDDAVTSQAVRLKGAASPGGGQRATVHSFSANAKVVASFDHIDINGGRLIVDIQNPTTGNWLRFSDNAWVASRPANVVPQEILVPGEAASHQQSKVFTMEGTGSTLLYRFQQQSTTPGDDSDLAHIQFEEGLGYPTSRMVTTDAADFTRDDDELETTNSLQQEAVPMTGDQFSIQLVMRPLFSFGDGDEHVIFGGWRGSGTPYWAVYFKSGTGFVFRTNTDGFVAASAVDVTFDEDDEIKILMRRASDRGEQDLGALGAQLAVAVNGVWTVGGIVDASSQELLEATDHELYLGWQDFTDIGAPGDQLDSWLTWMRCAPLVFPLEEGKDFP